MSESSHPRPTVQGFEDCCAMEREHLLDCLLDTIQDGIVFLDADHNILLINKFMERIVAHKLPVVGKKCYSVFHRRQDPCPECPLLKDQQAEMPRSRVFSHPPEKTPPSWYELRVYELRNDHGVVTGVLEHVREISEHRRADERLKDEITRRRMLVKQSRDGIVVMNADGSVYEANDQYARMLGYSLEEVQKLHIWDWDTEFEKHELLAMIDAIDDAGDHFETRHRRKDGTEFEVEISSNGAVLDGKKYVFCVCRDVSEKKAMEKQIRELATRDPLTEVYNRRYVFERLTENAAEYSRGGAAFSVAILDLDHFKAVNDDYGHLAGDHALREFTRMMGSLIREYDLLGRYGGEEFILVSRNAIAAETAAVIERLLDALRHRRFGFEGHEIRLTCSCGLADSSEIPREGFSSEALVNLADRRLYEAKDTGRDRYVGPVRETVRS